MNCVKKVQSSFDVDAGVHHSTNNHYDLEV